MNKLIQNIVAIIALSFSSFVFAGYEEDLDVLANATVDLNYGQYMSNVLGAYSDRRVFFEDEKKEARQVLIDEVKQCFIKKMISSKEISIKEIKWATSQFATVVKNAGSLKKDDLNYYFEKLVRDEGEKRQLKSRSEAAELYKELTKDFSKAGKIFKAANAELPSDICLDLNKERDEKLKEIAN